MKIKSKMLRLTGGTIGIIGIFSIFFFTNTQKAYADCEFLDLGCHIGEQLDGWWLKLWKDAMSAVGHAIADLFTWWFNIPLLEANSKSDSQSGAAYSPMSETVNFGNTTISIQNILGWTVWIGAAIAIAMLIVFAVKLAMSRQSGGVMETSKPLMYICGGIFIISSACALVAGLAPNAIRSTDMISWITEQMWPITLIALIFGVIVCGIRIIMEQNGKSLKEMVSVIFTTVFIGTVGGAIVQILATIGDNLAKAMVQNATDCTGADTQCLGEKIVDLFAYSGLEGAWTMALIVIVIGTVTSLIQAGIMVARSIMLVLVVGMLAFWSSLRYTDIGRDAFKKCIGWIVALLFYKPAAAVIYSTALKLMGSHNSGIQGIIYVITAMILAIAAMPALMKIVAPISGGSSGGGGMLSGIAGGAMTAMAMGGSSGGESKGGDLASKAMTAGKAVITGGGSLAADIPKEMAKSVAKSAAKGAVDTATSTDPQGEGSSSSSSMPVNSGGASNGSEGSSGAGAMVGKVVGSSTRQTRTALGAASSGGSINASLKGKNRTQTALNHAKIGAGGHIVAGGIKATKHIQEGLYNSSSGNKINTEPKG